MTDAEMRTICVQSDEELRQKTTQLLDLQQRVDLIRNQIRTERISTLTTFLLHSDKQYFHDHSPCGLGKTTNTAETLIDLSEFKSICWIVPAHVVIDANDRTNLEDILDRNKESYLHLHGKDAVINGVPYCYLHKSLRLCPGCRTTDKKYQKYKDNWDSKGLNFESAIEIHPKSKKPIKVWRCKYRYECQWQRQWQEAITLSNEGWKYRWVLGTYDMLETLIRKTEQHRQFDVEVNDESYEQRCVEYYPHTFKSQAEILNNTAKFTEVPINERLAKHFKIFNFVGDSSTIEVKDESSYLMHQFFNQSRQYYTTFHGKIDSITENYPQAMRDLEATFVENMNLSTENNGHYTVFAANVLPRFSYPHKVIFNCATTSVENMCDIYRTKPDEWEIYNPSHIRMDRIANPTLIVRGKWGYQKTNNDDNKKYIKESLYQFDKEFFETHHKHPYIVFVSKNKIEKELKAEYKLHELNIGYVHYCNGRGFNNLDRQDGIDLVVMYGRFGFTQLDREQMHMIGKSHSQIDDMEKAECLQALHRARLLIHIATPVLFCTDTRFVKTIMDESKYNNSLVDLARIKDYFKYHIYKVDSTFSVSDLCQRCEYSSDLGSNFVKGKSLQKIRSFFEYTIEH